MMGRIVALYATKATFIASPAMPRVTRAELGRRCGAFRKPFITSAHTLWLAATTQQQPDDGWHSPRAVAAPFPQAHRREREHPGDRHTTSTGNPTTDRTAHGP